MDQKRKDEIATAFMKGGPPGTSPVKSFLWLWHDVDHFSALYGDDCEMQCSMCFADFKRNSFDDLMQFLRKRAIEGQPGALTLEELDFISCLAIASHADHGVCDGSGPAESDCPCRGTDEQALCGDSGCGFCVNYQCEGCRRGCSRTAPCHH